uniref:Uncharacterized protein n=1 Tax=Arundo donax TaxID=35708 RepID=A0A0A9ARG7_ARUDO
MLELLCSFNYQEKNSKHTATRN